MENQEKKGERLAKNTLIVTIGKISTQIITFFLLPMYTYYLTTSEYGVVDLMSTLVSFLLPIITLQMEQGVFRFLIDCRGKKEESEKLITTTFAFLFFQCVALVIIFSLVSPWIHNEYKWFLLTNVIGCIFSSMLLQISRGLGDNLKYTIGSVVISGATIIFNIIFIPVLKLGAYGMLLGTLLGYLCGILYILISKKIYKLIHIKKYEKKLLKELLKYSIPLVPTMVSWWIVNISDRLLITYFIGMGMNGVYSVANKFSSMITMIYGIFNLTWTEAAAVNIDSKGIEEFFNQVYDKVVKFMGCLCIGIMAIMPLVINLLVDAKFLDAYYQIPILIVAAYFCNLSSFEGGIYIARKKSKDVAKSTVVAAVLNILINVTLIKFIGLYAASLSSLIAYLTIYIYRLIDLKKYVQLKLKKSVAFSIYFYMILTIIIFYLNHLELCIVNVFIAVIFSITLNWKTLMQLIKMIKSKIYKKNYTNSEI